MRSVDYALSYERLLEKLTVEYGYDRAMELVVGGLYAESGMLEASALIHLGLGPEQTLVDVGCGSGRLPFALRSYLRGKFVGTDILAPTLDYARQKCDRRDWEFIPVDRVLIPVANLSADFVTFFSVFTHLLDEDIFKFLIEAKRVLKPDGCVVFSFLDFDCDSHWPLFLKTVDESDPNRVLNKFTTKGAIRRLVRGAALQVQTIFDGQERWVPLSTPVALENSGTMEGVVEFGQSVAVCTHFPEVDYLSKYQDVKEAVTAGFFRSGAHHYEVCGHAEGRRLDGAARNGTQVDVC